jgi:hypothetical protein
MVGQHDSPCANPDRARASGDISNHHRRRGTCNADHVMMLGEPESSIAPLFSVLREIERVCQRLTRCGTLRHESKVED